MSILPVCLLTTRLASPCMAARRRAPAVTPAPRVLPLSYNDLRFINEYEARLFQSPGHIDAYQVVHPRCKRESARISAERVLQKATVKAEIQDRIEASRAVTPEVLGACLVRYRQWAEDAKDHLGGASIVMDQAKLAGFLVEKREIKTLTDGESSAIRSLVHQSMRAPSILPRSMPTPAANSENGEQVSSTHEVSEPAVSAPGAPGRGDA